MMTEALSGNVGKVFQVNKGMFQMFTNQNKVTGPLEHSTNTILMIS